MNDPYKHDTGKPVCTPKGYGQIMGPGPHPETWRVKLLAGGVEVWFDQRNIKVLAPKQGGMPPTDEDFALEVLERADALAPNSNFHWNGWDRVKMITLIRALKQVMDKS